jgi:hypothetical protein
MFAPIPGFDDNSQPSSINGKFAIMHRKPASGLVSRVVPFTPEVLKGHAAPISHLLQWQTQSEYLASHTRAIRGILNGQPSSTAKGASSKAWG